MTNVLLMLEYILSDSAEEYTEMTRLSSNSYKKNLAGDWSLDVLSEDFSHLPRKEALNQMWRDCIWAMFDHWVDGNNVLYVDSDTLMVKPTEIFGRWDKLQLFWPTDPKEGYSFNPYLNGGVVYMPGDIRKDLWWGIRSSIDSFRDWNDSQILWNRMYYTGGSDDTPLHPELNWQRSVDSPITEDEAHIIHYNSTRGAAKALNQMRGVCV